MSMVCVMLLFFAPAISNRCHCAPKCPCITCDCSANVQFHAACTSHVGLATPTGVTADKLGRFGERYTLNGKPVSKQQAIEAVVTGQLPDDAHKSRLTIIGAEADRQKVLTDFENAEPLRTLRSDLVIQDYEPDAALIRGFGFKGDGAPTIYLQAPTGQVMWRMDHYEGAEPLAAAIRRARPDYDPSKDPTGKLSLPRFMRVPPALWIAGAAGIVLLLWRKKS